MGVSSLVPSVHVLSRRLSTLSVGTWLSHSLHNDLIEAGGVEREKASWLSWAHNLLGIEVRDTHTLSRG